MEVAFAATSLALWGGEGQALPAGRNTAGLGGLAGAQPDRHLAHECHRPCTTLDATDALDGEDVVPGFAISVAELFADPLD